MTVRGVMAVALVVVLAAAGPTAAQEQSPQERAEELAQEGLDRLLLALDALLEAIPQYELPEVLENGDIIIRRSRPGDEELPDDMDET